MRGSQGFVRMSSADLRCGRLNILRRGIASSTTRSHWVIASTWDLMPFGKNLEAADIAGGQAASIERLRLAGAIS